MITCLFSEQVTISVVHWPPSCRPALASWPAVAVLPPNFPKNADGLWTIPTLSKMFLKFGVNGRFPGCVYNHLGLSRYEKSTTAAVERLVFYNPFRLIFHSGSNLVKNVPTKCRNDAVFPYFVLVYFFIY